MGKKDIYEKRLEDMPDVFADINNVANFRGVPLVKPESLMPGPAASLYVAEDGAVREQIRDVVKYCGSLGAVIMLLGIENQSDIDYDMVFRVMRYDGASYRMQKDAREKYPVITTVLYFGLKRWNVPRSIREAICKDIPEWSRVIEVVPDYRINVVEVAFLPEEVRRQFTSDFRIVAEYFHAVRTGTLEDFYQTPEARKELDHVEEMLDFMQVFGRDERYGAVKPELMMRKEKGEDVTMCILLDYAENKGVQRGIHEGIAQGITQGITQGIETGIRAVIEVSRELGQSYELTLEKVMEKFQLDSVQAGERMSKYWNV